VYPPNKKEDIQNAVVEISNWLWNGPQKTHNQIDDKLWEFVEKLGIRLED
jgi:hypothetical protein